MLALPQALVNSYKYVAIAIAAVIGIVALICGIVKGFYRISRRWIKFFALLATFFLLCAKLGDKNPLTKIAFVGNLAPDLRAAVVVGSYLLGSILAVNIVFGVIDAIVKTVAIKKLERSLEVSDHPDPKKRMREQRKIDNSWKPNAFSRICGGFACVLNVGAIVAFFLGIALYVCLYIPALSGDLLEFLYNDIPAKLLAFLCDYALDAIAILFIVSVSYCGYRAGALNGIGAIFSTFGVFAVGICALVLPFLPVVYERAVFTPVAFLSQTFEGWLANVTERFAPLLGKTICGATLALVFSVLFVLLGKLVRLIARKIRRVAVIRVVDGSICFVFTLVLALVAVTAVAAILLSLEYAGAFGESFRFTSLYTKNSPLQNLFEQLFVNRLAPLIENLKDLAGGVIGN